MSHEHFTINVEKRSNAQDLKLFFDNISIFPFSTFRGNRNVMDTIFIDYSDEKIWETNQETPLYLRKRKKKVN